MDVKWRVLSRFGVIMFFRKDPPQTEGRRDADLLIKTSPEGAKQQAVTGSGLPPPYLRRGIFGGVDSAIRRRSVHVVDTSHIPSQSRSSRRAGAFLFPCCWLWAHVVAGGVVVCVATSLLVWRVACMRVPPSRSRVAWLVCATRAGRPPPRSPLVAALSLPVLA